MSRTNEYGQPVGASMPGWQPRPRPARVTLTGRYVALEPIDRVHAAPLHAALCGSDDAAMWTYRHDEMPEDLEAMAERVRGLRERTDGVTFAIVPAAGAASGVASLMRVDAAAGSAEVGGILYARTLQRTRAATEAMVLLMRYVFDDLGYRRYEWKLDSLNAPSVAAARRLGFTYEGRFRNATVYKLRTRDTDWFAMTDTDFMCLRPAYDAWLDQSNFDEDGSQRRSLSALTSAALRSPGSG